jgi:hypothetical protein
MAWMSKPTTHRLGVGAASVLDAENFSTASVSTFAHSMLDFPARSAAISHIAWTRTVSSRLPPRHGY